ncbi:MAG: hypothetical protein LBN25_01715, partial [Christensenellaceae bacterium]|nr:hypothetical protein [Christensenellaceae bacterium]
IFALITYPVVLITGKSFGLTVAFFVVAVCAATFFCAVPYVMANAKKKKREEERAAANSGYFFEDVIPEAKKTKQIPQDKAPHDKFVDFPKDTANDTHDTENKPFTNKESNWLTLLGENERRAKAVREQEFKEDGEEESVPFDTSTVVKKSEIFINSSEKDPAYQERAKKATIFARRKPLSGYQDDTAETGKPVPEFAKKFGFGKNTAPVPAEQTPFKNGGFVDTDDDDGEFTRIEFDNSDDEEYSQIEEESEPVKKGYGYASNPLKPFGLNARREDAAPARFVKKTGSGYNAPPIGLLTAYPSDTHSLPEDYIEVKGKIEVRLIENGTPGTVNSCTKGPSVSRYEVKLDNDGDTPKMRNLELPLKTSLSARSITIEAPISGKDTIGFTLPNKEIAIVGFRTMVESPDFWKSGDDELSFAMGKDLDNKPRYGTLVKLSHLLIAGATNSGKSTLAHCILQSLLYRYSPEDFKLVIIDKKRISYIAYANLPHMLVKNPIFKIEEISKILDYLSKEIDNRNSTFGEYGAVDLIDYNKKAKKSGGTIKKIPRIIVFIDELNDLMIEAKRITEDYLARFALLGRSAGIHMLIATQHPSKDCISSKIISNIPGRIALRVSDHNESRLIIPSSDAKDLLGYGDMLFLNPFADEKLSRIQAAYVTDDEIRSITDYIKDNNKAGFDMNIEAAISAPAQDELPREREKETVVKKEIREEVKALNREDDSLARGINDPALRAVLQSFIVTGKGSVAVAQTKVRINQKRATDIVNALEAGDYITRNDGGNTYRVNISMQQFAKDFPDE